MGVARIPDDIDLGPDETLQYAQDLIDQGLAFNAHEVLEAAWKSCAVDERQLWQGLAQLAVGITHIQRGNGTGAIALLRRGSDKIRGECKPARHGIDVAGLVAHADALIADLVADVDIPSERLKPRLSARRDTPRR